MGEIHELPVPELANIVTRIVIIDGPVHQEEIASRVASLWGLKRTGSRISDAVEKALAEATHRRRVIQTGLFFQMHGTQEVPVRNREQVKPTNLRKPDYLPPAEIAAAVVAIVSTHLGVPVDETISEVARLFGFKATSAQLRQVVQDEIVLLTEQAALEQRNGKLYVVQNSQHVPA